MITKKLEEKIIRAFKSFLDSDGYFMVCYSSQLRLLSIKMKKLGFYKIKHRTARGPFYTNGKIVVKKPLTVVGNKPKNAVETKIIKIKNDEIWVQPLVNTKNNKRFQKYEYKEGFGQDPHKWNFGIYKKKIVVFDW